MLTTSHLPGAKGRSSRFPIRRYDPQNPNAIIEETESGDQDLADYLAAVDANEKPPNPFEARKIA